MAKPTRIPAWVLVLAFVAIPLVEIWAIIQVGQLIGAWPTILLLILDSVVGAWLVRREGGRAWRALTTAINTGKMPAKELADGALLLIGGTLMLTPGFVTDAVGLFLIAPFTRPFARGALTRVVTRRLLVTNGRFPSPQQAPNAQGPTTWGPTQGPTSQAPNPQNPGAGPVIKGEVIDD